MSNDRLVRVQNSLNRGIEERLHWGVENESRLPLQDILVRPVIGSEMLADACPNTDKVWR